jgi:cell division protease FtsH
MEETYHRSKQVLVQNRVLLDEMAEKLLEKEVLDSGDLQSFLSRVQGKA